MGGKRKILTQTRRTALKKEMTEALIAGTFTTNNRPLDEVLDEVNQGIVEGRYPIEVDLATLINIWTGQPVPTEAPAPEPQPTNHGTVDQIQQAQQNGQPVPQMQAQGGPPWTESPSAQAIQQTGTWPPQEHYPVPQQVPPPSSAEQAATQYPVVEQPSPLAVAAGTAPGMMVPTAVGMQPVQQVGAQPMTLQQAQAAMQAVDRMEVGEPPKPEPVNVDAGPVADWVQLARDAQAKIDAAKDILEAAKANVSAYADQIGGPDRSKVLLINGHLVMRRTFVVKSTTDTKRLAAEHPEIDIEVYKTPTSYYRTEFV